MIRFVLTAFFLVMLNSMLIAQAGFKVSGKITDQSGKSVPNASVKILNTNLQAVADKNGDYEIPALPEGIYEAEVSADGFPSKSYQVTVNGSLSLDVRMDQYAKELDAVVITAQKREELLQQVPLSVSAISSRKVQEYRLWNARELTAIVPNLYSSNPGDNRNVTSVRGITSTSYDPAVATYIDGVNQFNLDTYIPELIDIERIEVLRGPQGTLYGRNTMGGVINIITKQPSNRTSGFAEAHLGNYGRQRYTAGVRTPLVKNKLYLGVAGMYNQNGGIYTNEFNNTKFDKQRSGTGNYYLKYLPAASWTITANFKHHNNRNNGPFTLINGMEEAMANPFKLSQNATTTMIDNSMNASLSVNHSGNKINFNSLTAYQTNHRYYMDPIDGDFSPADIVTIINDYGKDWNNVKVFTQEFRFSSPASADSRLKWTAGTYFFHQNNPTRQATRFGADAGLFGIPDINFATINNNSLVSSGLAFFGQAAFAINDKLDVIGGIRYDNEWKELTVQGEYQKDPDPQPMIIFPETAGKANFNAISPKLGLQYKATANTNAYLMYTRGYRAGGLTQLGSDPSVPPLYEYDPEYSNNVELGVKNTFLENKLRLNATLFYTSVTQAQVPTLVLPDAITITRNAGELNSKGFELEVSATPVRSFSIDYNFGYTDAKYTNLKVAQEGTEVNLDGKKQIFTPQFTSMLAAQKGFELSARHRLQLIVRGEWFVVGKQYFDLMNNISQDAFNLLNAKAGISTKYGDLFFWMRNIGDELYVDYSYDFGAVHLADPKTFGVTISTRF